MIDFGEIVQKHWHICLFMGIFILGSLVYTVIRFSALKRSIKKYLQDHPNAARIYMATRAFITREAVTINVIDGTAPQQFLEKGKTGFYVIPGKRKVEMSYAFSHPGILHKTITKVYGPVTRELETEPNKSYLVGFDRGTKNFTFTEV